MRQLGRNRFTPAVPIGIGRQGPATTKIRPLVWNDFDRWLALYYTRFDEVELNPDLGVFVPETRPSVSERAKAFGELYKGTIGGDAVCYVAEQEDEIVGVCAVRARSPADEDRHVGRLVIFVRPERRAAELGTALLRAVLDACPDRFEIVELDVLSVNEPAIRLYRRLGFEEYGRQSRGFRRKGRYRDLVLMQRTIPSPPPGAPGESQPSS
jgi:RimJ/RimL family protein N-acetyltransferase